MKMTEISPPDNSRQICPKCNSPVAPEMKFCESCGAKIDDLRRCSQCGAPLSKGTKFCESCGASLDESMAAHPSVVPLAVPKHAPAPGKIKDTQNYNNLHNH
jgi:predicted amidophosphoribosyltransferase